MGVESYAKGNQSALSKKGLYFLMISFPSFAWGGRRASEKLLRIVYLQTTQQIGVSMLTAAAHLDDSPYF